MSKKNKKDNPANKIPRSQRQKANKKQAQMVKKHDKTNAIVYGIGFVGLCISYYSLLLDFDISLFFLTAIVTFVWVYMFYKYILAHKVKR